MNTYTVKSGQNLFDVAMTLYGSIEGIFDLLTSNAEREGQASLSYDTSLSAGDVLNYNPDFVINNSIKTHFGDNSIKVANGEHIYSYTGIKTKMTQCVSDYNQKVLSTAIELYPNVWNLEGDSMLSDYNKANAEGFYSYINENYWGCKYTNVEYISQQHINSTIERASEDENTLFINGLSKVKMFIVHSGQLSSFTGKLVKHTILGIDWGDASDIEIHYDDNEEETAFEHCYEDDGQHWITLYGSFIFKDLDFTSVGGVYYPIQPISVKGSFKSKFESDNIINQLISVSNNE